MMLDDAGYDSLYFLALGGVPLDSHEIIIIIIIIIVIIIVIVIVIVVIVVIIILTIITIIAMTHSVEINSCHFSYDQLHAGTCNPRASL